MKKTPKWVFDSYLFNTAQSFEKINSLQDNNIETIKVQIVYVQNCKDTLRYFLVFFTAFNTFRIQLLC